MSDFPLSVQGISAAYEALPVIEDISFDLPKGSLAAIIGPNGAGKSTLLKAMLGLVPLRSGKAVFFGEPFARSRNRVAYVPQRAGIDWSFPANVLDVALMGLYPSLGWLRWPRLKHRQKAMEALDQVGMADFQNRQIGQLSGGQQQRVFLARALAQEAEFLILDEPFAGIDAASEAAIVTLFRSLQQRGRTVLSVHHDLETAPVYFDWGLLLNQRVVATGPMQEIFTPENLQDAYGGRLAVFAGFGRQFLAGPDVLP